MSDSFPVQKALIAVVVLLAVGALAVFSSHEGLRAQRSPAAGAPAAPPSTSVAGGGAGVGVASVPAASQAAAPREHTAAVRYTFDRGEAVADLRTAVAAGGAIVREARDGGEAVRFPAPCAVYGDPACPRAILESGPSPALNPGARPLRFGASVRLRPEETTEGSNVVQKGFALGRSQYKLQIDGRAGRPSCVLVGTDSPAIHTAASAVSVADGGWHAVECARDGAALTIVVDGTVTGRATVPERLSVVNTLPLRIGGKGTSPNNDQFHGALDDVYVTVG
jgi:hypothetical protein